MRANEHRLERCVAARTCAYDVSRSIKANVEPGFLHEFDGVGAPLKIGLGVGHAAHATLRIRSELRQGAQVIVDPLSVSPEFPRPSSHPRPSLRPLILSSGHPQP